VIKVNDAAQENLTLSDTELVALATSGDRAAFALLYDRYYSRAHRLAYTMTGPRGGAEDLTQEIFMRVYQRLDSFNGQSSFATWFYRLAVNHSLNYRRRAHAKAEDSDHTLLERIASDARQGESSILQKQIQTEVHTALLGLRPEMRLVVILKDLEGLNYDEIAERMNCSPGTVASRLNRGRKQLAKKLKHLKGAW
jgi:RNA polymerase sigma-70 factor, ECF subfamily